MTFILAVLATALTVGATAPVATHQADAVRQDALETVAQPLTPTLQDDRTAAVTYLDDTLTLLQLAQTHLHGGEIAKGRAELMSASGKLSTAQLILFKDRGFTRSVARLSLRAEEAYRLSAHHVGQAADLAAEIAHDLRPLYRTQTARLGGGAGQALEPLNNIRR